MRSDASVTADASNPLQLFWARWSKMTLSVDVGTLPVDQLPAVFHAVDEPPIQTLSAMIKFPCYNAQMKETKQTAERFDKFWGSVSEWPISFRAKKVIRRLAETGVLSKSQLRRLDDLEFFKFKNCGWVTLREIRSFLGQSDPLPLKREEVESETRRLQFEISNLCNDAISAIEQLKATAIKTIDKIRPHCPSARVSVETKVHHARILGLGGSK